MISIYRGFIQSTEWFESRLETWNEIKYYCSIIKLLPILQSDLPLQLPWPPTRAVPRVRTTLSWHRSCRLASSLASWWPSCASESAQLPHWSCARTSISSNRNSYIPMRNSHVRAICKLRTKSHCHWVTPRRCTTRRIPMLCPTMRVSYRFQKHFA